MFDGVTTPLTPINRRKLVQADIYCIYDT